MSKKAKFARMLLAELPVASRKAWSGLTADERQMITDDAGRIAEETRYWGAGFGGEGLQFAADGRETVAHRIVNGKMVACELVAVRPSEIVRAGKAQKSTRVVAKTATPQPKAQIRTVDGKLVVHNAAGYIERVEDMPAAPEHAHLDADMTPRLQDASIAIVNERAASANRVIRSTPVEQVGDKAGVRWGHEHGVEKSINAPAPKRRHKKPSKAEVKQAAAWLAEANAAHEAR